MSADCIDLPELFQYSEADVGNDGMCIGEGGAS